MSFSLGLTNAPSQAAEAVILTYQHQGDSATIASHSCSPRLGNTGDKCEFNPKTSNLKRQSTALHLKFDENNSVGPMLSLCIAIDAGMAKTQFASNYAEFIVLNSAWQNCYWEGTIEREI